MESDQVDQLVEQWQRERPDLDVTGMEIIGRLSRLEKQIRPRLNAVFALHDLESWEFDVLATLRRSGEPYQLTAGQLLASMMITSGTMTNRLDRLEHRQLIQRIKDPSDGRVVLARLTNEGFAKIDAALVDHTTNETEIIDGLTKREQKQLIDLLRTLLGMIDATDG